MANPLVRCNLLLPAATLANHAGRTLVVNTVSNNLADGTASFAVSVPDGTTVAGTLTDYDNTTPTPLTSTPIAFSFRASNDVVCRPETRACIPVAAGKVDLEVLG